MSRIDYRTMFTGLFAAAVFIIIASPAYALENKDVYFGGTAKESASDFSRVKIRGTISEIPNATIPSAMVLSASGKTYVINIGASAKIVRKIGGKSSLKEFIVGDAVEVAGTINADGTIKGKTIKNLSISQLSYKKFDGIVKSVNTAANSFVIVRTGKKYSIKANKATKIAIPGIKSKISLRDLKVGDHVYGRTALNNIRKKNTAEIVFVLQRNSIETVGQNTAALEGAITKIGSTVFPAELEIFNGADYNIISVSGNTVIARNNFSQSFLAEFQVGDNVRIIGAKDKIAPLKINAKLLKNESLKTLSDLSVHMA